MKFSKPIFLYALIAGLGLSLGTQANASFYQSSRLLQAASSLCSTMWRHPGLSTLASATAVALIAMPLRKMSNELWICDNGNNVIDEAEKIIRDKKSILYWQSKEFTPLTLVKEDLAGERLFRTLRQDFLEEYNDLASKKEYRSENQNTIEILFATKIKSKIKEEQEKVNVLIDKLSDGLKKSRFKYWFREYCPVVELPMVKTEIDERMEQLIGKDNSYNDLTSDQYDALISYSRDTLTDIRKHPWTTFKRVLSGPREGKAARVYLKLKILMARMDLIEKKINSYLKNKQPKYINS